jgi:hypothetical protein
MAPPSRYDPVTTTRTVAQRFSPCSPLIRSRSCRLSLHTAIRLHFNGSKKNYFQVTICNYFSARSSRHLFLGRCDGLQANLPLPPSPISKVEVFRSPCTTTSQVLQIFRWLIATLNNVSNIQPKTQDGQVFDAAQYRISLLRVTLPP